MTVRRGHQRQHRVSYIKTVELGDAVLGNELRDARIPFGHPSKELGDTHGYSVEQWLRNVWEGGKAARRPMAVLLGKQSGPQETNKKRFGRSSERRAKALKVQRQQKGRGGGSRRWGLQRGQVKMAKAMGILTACAKQVGRRPAIDTPGDWPERASRRAPELSRLTLPPSATARVFWQRIRPVTTQPHSKWTRQ